MNTPRKDKWKLRYREYTPKQNILIAMFLSLFSGFVIGAWFGTMGHLFPDVVRAWRPELWTLWVLPSGLTLLMGVVALQQAWTYASKAWKQVA